jgi:hypothetical protein
MDGDYRFDMDEIVRNIDSSEVISLFFPLLRKTLLLDTRVDIEDGPMVKVVPMVDSVEERFRVLKRMRPRLPKPDSIIVIPWPKHVNSLKRLGIWDRISERMASTGVQQAIRECENCFEVLLEHDQAELAAVITGENYYTLWEAPR